MMGKVSVSKGVFPFKRVSFNEMEVEDHYKYSNNPWYIAYNEIRNKVEDSTKEINEIMYKHILQDLHSFVSKVNDESMEILPTEIPTAILLAGINVPDHVMLFEKVMTILSEITPYIGTISSKNCNNMKSMVETSIYQIMNANIPEDEPIIKKIHCTFRALNSWYKESNREVLPLIFIVRDFENFSAKALHDFTYSLRTYSNMKIVLVFGVATSLHIVHRTLSYEVMSKLRIKVFSTRTQVMSLSDILEGIVFTHQIPFRLVGSAFNLLQENFLFYDLSVDGFLQAYKICLAKHFFANNGAALCCALNDIEERIESLPREDIEDLKRMPSIAHYIEGKEEFSEQNFKKFLATNIHQFQNYMNEFLAVLQCFHVFVKTLPNAPLGKLFREVYSRAVSSNLLDLEEYKHAMQLLKYLCKEELLSKITEVLKVVAREEKYLPKDLKGDLEKNFEVMSKASLEVLSSIKPEENEQYVDSMKSDFNELRGRLKRMTFVEDLRNKAQKHMQSPFKKFQEYFIDYLDKEVFSVYLRNPMKLLGYEIFCFYNRNSVRHHIKGSLGNAIRTALKDPYIHLKCTCCKLKNEDCIPNTLPDLSIVYRLHLENRKLINMYDWLQAFLAIIDPSESDEQDEVDPALKNPLKSTEFKEVFLKKMHGNLLVPRGIAHNWFLTKSPSTRYRQ